MAQEAVDILDVADQLRAARKEQKLSIADVAKEICVRACYLDAIEERRYSDLPGKTFVIGFVKSYAKMLKLDPQVLSEQFKIDYAAYCGQEGTGVSSNARMVDPSSTSDKALNQHSVQLVAPEKRQWPAWLSPVVGLVGAGMSWFLVGTNTTVSSVAVIDSLVEERTLAQFNEAPSVEALNAVMENETDERVAVKKGETVEQEVQSAAIEPYSATSIFLPAAHAANHVPIGVQSNEITLQAVEDSWIQLFYRDGTEMWSGVLRSGQSYRPQLIGEVLLTTSNAGGIILKRSDASLGSLGERGSVINALALDSSIFEAETFSGAALTVPVVGGSD